MVLSVREYERADSKVPFREWLATLDRTARARILGESEMARRSRDWNEGLAQDLRDQKFAREFLMAAMWRRSPLGAPVAHSCGAMWSSSVRTLAM